MISTPFKTAQSLDFLQVYLITDLMRIGQSRFLGAVEEALQGGIRTLQLREKNLSPKDLLSLALEIKPLVTRYNAKLFINDRADMEIPKRRGGG